MGFSPGGVAFLLDVLLEDREAIDFPGSCQIRSRRCAGWEDPVLARAERSSESEKYSDKGRWPSLGWDSSGVISPVAFRILATRLYMSDLKISVAIFR
jgi:hypothetical protein